MAAKATRDVLVAAVCMLAFVQHPGRAEDGPSSVAGDDVLPDPMAGFECGTMTSDEALTSFRAAVAAGQVPDPALLPPAHVLPFPDPAVRGGGVPTVTANDLFIYEDSGDVLVTNFSDGQLFGIMADATRALLAQECDRFDFVAFFLNFTPNHTIGAAFYLGLFNDTSGLGLGNFDNRLGFGIETEKLQGWVMMWNQASWGVNSFTRLVLGQEFEHRWGMFLNDISGGRSLQGFDDSCGRGGHWNFRVDGQGSGMEIREWIGANPANRSGGTLSFCTDIPGGVWSYPDLYLMGYVSPSEMDSGASELRYMNDGCGTPYSGVITNWSSADVIATSGSRSPNSAQSQKDFRCGWIVIHRPGLPPTTTQKNNIVNILNQWSVDWNVGTLGRGTLDNTLFRDCNGNGVHDAADVAGGTSQNCNGNCLLDECEITLGLGTDCNANNRLDECDLAEGTSADCNANALPDECDIAVGTSIDCTGNATPDECETDCNHNGVRDDCDLASAASLDCDANARPDECDIAAINQIFDCNSNGIPDPCDFAAQTSRDCDATGIPDECDTEVCFSAFAGFEPVPPFTVATPIHGVNFVPDAKSWDNPTGTATIVNGGCPSGGKAVKTVSQTPPTTDFLISENFHASNGGLDDGAPVQSLLFDVRSEAQLNPRIDWQLSIKDASNDLSVILIHWASTQSSYPGVASAQKGKILVANPANPSAFLTLSPAFTIPSNTCYSMKVKLNNVTGAVELSINDTLRLTTTRLNANAKRLDYFRLEQKANGQAAGGVNRLAFDNFQLCEIGGALTPGGLLDCNANSVRDDCDIASGTSTDANVNGVPDECEGVPAATITSAISRKGCDLPLTPPRLSEPRQGGVSEVRIAFDVPPGGPGAGPVTLEQATCAAPAFVPYGGASVIGASTIGNELVLTFTPGLENARTYRMTLSAAVTSIPGQTIEVRGLVGDVNSDGQVNAVDRSVVVGAWTGSGFTCATDVDNNSATNAVDRSIIVGAWTGGQNCAP